MENETIVIMLNSGEIIITEIDDVDPLDDTNYRELSLYYPAMIIPIPAQQPNQPNQIGFQKYFPFSDQDKDMKIRRAAIRTVSTAVADIKRAYGEWVTQVKAQEAGIIVPK